MYRLMASPGKAGQEGFTIFSCFFRRGGVSPGAAGFIAIESTMSGISEISVFPKKKLIIKPEQTGSYFGRSVLSKACDIAAKAIHHS